ncbi:MAG: S-layer homology domain-containing protein [Oscillospiraceae bacterium]|nr:S-layer homology domain-containing protein [Oscillospiraceae bacterium]
MKKRFFAAVLALALTLSLTPAAFALGGFADVTNTAVAQNVEVLRLMGVIGGDENGSFRPNSNLTRAEFCKMAIELQGRGDQIVRYRSRTVFPDVRAAHWAAGYINLATTASGENMPAVMHGNPDGNFAPDRNITYGEAVTVLARALGYTDKDSGGVWPQGYIALGAACGLTKGLSNDPNGAITRAQAAQLFVNALRADKSGGGTLMTMGKETTLLSVDIAKGTLRLVDGTTVEMVHPGAVSTLTGLRGRVVYDAKETAKALTFLPTVSTAGTGAIANAAVILTENGSVAGVEGLTGGATNYSVYRNGVRLSRAALKRGDVVTYSASANALLACDTRVLAYYEEATPSPAAPVTVKALGTTFNVLPTAQQSLSLFKPGQQLVLQLTADGQIAGALSGENGSQSNALAYVDVGGKVSMICGGSLLALDCTVSGVSGQVGRITQDRSKVYVTVQSGGARGILDVPARKLGNTSLADNVMLIDENGRQTALGELTTQTVPADQIRYAHTDSAGRVDVIVMGSTLSKFEFFGRVIVDNTADGRTVAIDYGSGKTEGYPSYQDIATGDFAYMRVANAEGKVIESLEKLTKYSNVPTSAWIGDTAVTVSGSTFTIPSNVLIYNKDSGTWISDIETARSYGRADLYVRDAVVRAIEISS